MRGKNKGKYRTNRDFWDDDLSLSDYDEANVFGMSPPLSRSAPMHVPAADWKHQLPKAIKPRNEKQAEYLRLLNDPHTHIVIATGCAGTGKTFVGVSHAMEKLLAGEIKKIVITRPLVAVEDKNFGALPGTAFEKQYPYLLSVLDTVYKYVTPQHFQTLMAKGIVEICPLIFMRGRSFEHCFIIADEMQNSSPNQMLMLLTRLGEGSKMILDGDPSQTDKGFHTESGLVDLLYKLNLSPQEGFGLVHFTEEEVERHPLVKKVLRLYKTKTIPDV